MKSIYALRIVALALLLCLGVVTVAHAQVEEELPGSLNDLRLPAGLGVVVVTAVGLLKRAGKVGEWINSNSLHGFAVSLAVAGIVLAGIHLIEYFDLYELAQGFWANFVIAWSVAQALYNTQKVGTKGIRQALA